MAPVSNGAGYTAGLPVALPTGKQYPVRACGVVVDLKIWNLFTEDCTSPAVLKSSRLNGLGTTLSQTAIWPSTLLGFCGAPPARRLGSVGWSVPPIRWPAKLIGSAGSSTHLETCRNCRYAGVFGKIGGFWLARRAFRAGTNAGDVEAMSTNAPPGTLSTASL